MYLLLIPRQSQSITRIREISRESFKQRQNAARLNLLVVVDVALASMLTEMEPIKGCAAGTSEIVSRFAQRTSISSRDQRTA